jgi:hypothetical protein
MMARRVDCRDMFRDQSNKQVATPSQCSHVKKNNQSNVHNANPFLCMADGYQFHSCVHQVKCVVTEVKLKFSRLEQLQGVVQAISASSSSSSSNASMASFMYCVAWMTDPSADGQSQSKDARLTLGSKLSAVVKCLIALALS